MSKTTKKTNGIEKPFKGSADPNLKARNSCFAWNNYTEQNIIDFKEFIQKECSYGIFGKEICPTTGTPHLQCYIEFENQVRWRSVQTKLKYNLHYEPRSKNSTATKAADYCKKDGDFWEWGTLSNQGKRSDLNELRDQIMAGNTTVDQICVESPEYYHQYGRTLEKLETIANRKKFRTEMTQGFWYVGGTGTGKSHYAYTNFTPETHYVWKLNDHGWQDDYTGQKYVIIDDFRGEIPYNELLKLIDRWPYSVPRRNKGPCPFVSEVVIITSSLTPEETYHRRHDQDKIEQLLRRLQIVVLEKFVSEVPTGNTNAVGQDMDSEEFVREN